MNAKVNVIESSSHRAHLIGNLTQPLCSRQSVILMQDGTYESLQSRPNIGLLAMKVHGGLKSRRMDDRAILRCRSSVTTPRYAMCRVCPTSAAR